MGYLDRLKRGVAGNRPAHELPKLPEVPLGSKGSTYGARLQKCAVAIPAPSLSADDERDIRAWLARIEEIDPEVIASALRVCAEDEPSRQWCLALARGDVPQRH